VTLKTAGIKILAVDREFCTRCRWASVRLGYDWV